MARAKTTADLIEEASARVARATADGLVDGDELLELADQEMRSEMASILIGVRSEYWCTSYTVAITVGLADYRVPDRSLGMGLRDVTIYDVNGREVNVPQVDASRRYLLGSANPGSYDPARAFCFENGTLTLLPTPSVSGYTLRLRYYATPPTLTALENGAAIKSATTNSLTFFEAPTNADLMEGYVDATRGAGMHDTLFASNLTAADGADAVTLTDAIDATQFQAHAGASATPGLRVDYATIAGTTVYPPLPEILWPCLVSVTARAYCEAIGDNRGMDAAAAIFEARKRRAFDLLQPRVDGEPVQVIPLDTPLRGGGGRVRGWR